MSLTDALELKRAQKRVKELRQFLIELDSICDTLYDKLEYKGVWDALMELEEVRVQYYTEFYENETFINLKGTK